ncbi:hypothetical protein HMPREF9946_02593 [Acetobacteraceae bacterium AT-5844]|nr:hypothetical protein HMPREF9946_02593 [Acetobacteraceae bacterium AT-5844]
MFRRLGSRPEVRTESAFRQSADRCHFCHPLSRDALSFPPSKD